MASQAPYCVTCGAAAPPCKLNWFPSPCMCTKAEAVGVAGTREEPEVDRTEPPPLYAATAEQVTAAAETSKTARRPTATAS